MRIIYIIRGGNIVEKTFSEIKFFQVKPEKLEQFEAIADTISKEQIKQQGCCYSNQVYETFLYY